MLRIHFMQFWSGFNDPEMEDASYEITAIRQFNHLSLNQDHIPDEPTILTFRRLLDAKELAKTIFDEIAKNLTELGIYMAFSIRS